MFKNLQYFSRFGLYFFLLCLLNLNLGKAKVRYTNIAVDPDTALYNVALDLKLLFKGRKIKVKKSTSNLDAIDGLLKGDKENFLGLANYDVLILAHSYVNPKVGSLEIALPLFPTEAHMIIKKDRYKEFNQLKGKKIFVGKELSDSNLTLRVFQKKIDFDCQFEYGIFKDGLSKLLEEKVDAVFIVAPAPFNLLNDKQYDQKLDLLSIPKFTEKDEDYSRSIITGSHYSWLEKDIETYATTVMLIINDDQRLYADFLLKIIRSLTNPSALRKLGHPKWKMVKDQVEDDYTNAVHEQTLDFIGVN